jgi:hypothetical protein
VSCYDHAAPQADFVLGNALDLTGQERRGFEIAAAIFEDGTGLPTRRGQGQHHAGLTTRQFVLDQGRSIDG